MCRKELAGAAKYRDGRRPSCCGELREAVIVHFADGGLSFSCWETMLWIADYCWCNLYDQGLANGYLFSTGTATTADFSNTNAFHWFQTNLNAYVNLGVMGYKIDRGDEGETPDSVNNHNDTLFQQLVMGGLNAVYPNNAFVFSRCATDTARRYTALWSGDFYATFTGLQYSVIAGLRAGIINFPM